ncbi:hypothetical protein [Pedobacter ginsengisoli]|uniref:hypothetical protein n=1 Tax=Pedobacter ginsengisoli TaxID=363852 RepID=UPI00254E3BD4|nr:hypothetical protein [Pedobacter ginsengisoli]
MAAYSSYTDQELVAFMKNGPHGPIYGKVDNLVTYRLLNKDVLRMVGKIIERLL